MKQNELRIIDDGAKYGTTIRNPEIKKVSKEPMTLKDGDKVQFGCYENIWEIHCKPETRGGIKRKSSDAGAIENSLSESNISKKPKENPINAKIIDKFDVIIDSDDDMPSKGRGCRQRKNLINYSEDIVPSTSNDKTAENKNKKVTKIDEKPNQSNKKVEQAKKPQTDKVETPVEPPKPAKEVHRSQAVYDDSDEDIFSPSHQENVKSKGATNSRNIVIEPDDDLMSFNVPMKAANSRKRPSNDTEDGGSTKKIPRTVKNLKSQATNEIKKVVPQKSSTKKASNDEVDKSISHGPANSSQISRKRDLEDDDVFNFDMPLKHQVKKSKNVKKIENSSEELTPVPSTSKSTAKFFAFKTSKISDKEAYASFVYDDDEDSVSWLLTSRVSKIKVKDEPNDETDNSVENSIEIPTYNVKTINLNTTCESQKCFRKQKYLETNQVVTLKKINVDELNYCYSKKEELSRDDWSE